jgi:hypothetical protein
MTGTLLDHVVGCLIPLFLKGAGDDPALARRAAIQLLESYGVAGGRDLLLAAEVIAFSFATLDNLVRSLADPDMSIRMRLRLRSNANALSRAAERNRKFLEAARSDPAATVAAPPLSSTVVENARDEIVGPAPGPADARPSTGQPISRQQRRFLMRKAEQVRAAQAREGRKTARLAARATMQA